MMDNQRKLVASTSDIVEKKLQSKRDENNNAILNGSLNSSFSPLNDWCINQSSFSKLTSNPVRKMIEQIKIEPNPSLPMIALSIGDPTVLSDIQKPDTAIDAIRQCIGDKKNDGYTPSYGTETCRQAVAKYYSRPNSGVVYKFTDILLSSGCSQAIDLCITALASRGQNILIPRPGFSIYKTLCGTLSIDVKYYNLKENSNWEIDLDCLESLIDDKTVAIIVNNPSNPCGSVYSRAHLIDIINVAERFKIPIIADEVYGDMGFPNVEFCYMSELTQTVPILSCNSLSKRFILPGWRFGWIAIHDPKNYLKNVRQALNDLTTRILGPCSLVQSALPYVLENTTKTYYDSILKILSDNANIAYNKLVNLKGLQPKKPQGAMYMMVGIDFNYFPHLKNDMEFVQLLIKEKSVFCLPASIFECPNYIRLVITMRQEKIIEACDRIEEFINAHAKKA